MDMVMIRGMMGRRRTSFLDDDKMILGGEEKEAINQARRRMPPRSRSRTRQQSAIATTEKQQSSNNIYPELLAAADASLQTPSSRKRPTVSRQRLMGAVEDEIRVADPSRNERLLMPTNMVPREEDDEEERLMRMAIETSRREYMEQERHREEEERRREMLRARLAIPRARLLMWRQGCRAAEEGMFLDHILAQMDHAMTAAVPPPSGLPPRLQDPFQAFLSYLASSRLYADIPSLFYKRDDLKRGNGIEESKNDPNLFKHDSQERVQDH